MTSKQHRWYLREWSRAFAAHWCGVRDGEPLARPDRSDSPMREQVLAAARALVVRRGGGKLTADDLRHACHIVAIGRDVSSLRLTNKQIDLVVAVFRQLAFAVDLSSAMRLDAASAESSRRQADPAALPDADRKRMLWSIDHTDLPPAYKQEICRDKFGAADWRGLGDGDLHRFLITLQCRAASRLVAGLKRVNVASTL